MLKNTSNKNMHIKKGKVSNKVICLIMFVLFIIMFLLALSVGSQNIPILSTARIIIKKITGLGNISDIPQSFPVIIEGLRFPRVILAALVGAALSVSGTAMQGLLRNPLAESSTLGVSSGAALGAVLSIALGFSLPFSSELGITVVSILFAFVTFVVILTLSYKIDHNLSSNTIILTGIIISMLASSIISFMISTSGEKMKSIIFWTMGSFSGRGWDYVYLVLPFMAIGFTGILCFSRELNAFALGEEKAGYIGVNTKAVKVLILVFVSILVGVSVSVCGAIAFVGLVIPHITRMLIGPNHKILMPMSLLTGATFLMGADLVSRTIYPSSEVPIGVVTSLIGSVIFIYIFYSQRNKQLE
jgi:iron complex transport system permease protein